ncbi:MAG: hypothetical protein JSW52_10585 [Candidatus Coatesbacteria bacterium]|nr:MAG: hypothetical protein JSW52_10585 [Candidatus Coatesbacteria bacterium]
MPTELQIAYQLAPVFVQRVHHQNPRGDFITRIDFTDPENLMSLLDNWVAVNRLKEHRFDWSKEIWGRLLRSKQAPRFKYKLEPYIYYSVVETDNYYFVVYAAYHPQDWYIKPGEGFEAFNGPLPDLFDVNHEHDMEGALVVARKRSDINKLRADIIITLSHLDFYSYAFWYLTDKVGREFPVFKNVDENIYKGAKENIDGKIWAVWHTDENGTVTMRPQLFVEFKGHGIKAEKEGDKTGWAGDYRTIRYCPSLECTDEPALFREESPAPVVELDYRTSPDSTSGDRIARKEVYRYMLIDIFEENTREHPARGLWESRNTPEVFQPRGGLKCFAVLRNGRLKAGSAKPPWSWDDKTDPSDVKTGWLATHPAELILDYGYGEKLIGFTDNYFRNKYREI